MGKPDSRRGSLGLFVIVVLAGAGTMIVELAAVRVLAPWFGTSAAVWTNVIGVVLFALAFGYLVGAQLAARERPQASLALALFAGAAFTAWLPSLAGPVAGFFLPSGVTLARAGDLLIWGSLATSFALFAPAALALGCVGPLAVECLHRQSGEHAGSAGGRVLCASTLGSLAGTFGTTHYLLPTLGIAWTFYLAAAVMASLGVLSWWLARPRSTLGALPLLLAGSAVLGHGYGGPQLGEDTRLLESIQSPYQFVRVVERGEGEQLSRQLQVNEGFDSYQSVWQPQPGLLPPGYYYNYFALPAWWSHAEGDWSLLVLGLGAGTAWRVLEGTMPEGAHLDAHGVEIDPLVVSLARRWMDLPEDGENHRTLAGWDARAALSRDERKFDQIILDTYANQMEVPPHLSSVEFFELVEARLTPGGWLSINIGGFALDDPVVSAIAETAAVAFGSEALLLRVPFSRNVVAYLRRGVPLPTPGSSTWALPDGDVSALLAPCEMEGRWALMEPPVVAPLSDDRNAIETLQRRSLELAAAQIAAHKLR